MIGFDIIMKISSDLYKKAGICPNNAQVIELHDCFAPIELITYEVIGLCEVGMYLKVRPVPRRLWRQRSVIPRKGSTIVDRRDNTYGEKWVLNSISWTDFKGTSSRCYR
ncbi:hypothetical protein COOONC_26031 [Cooperia oncophora]